jgi:hypothetical protein
VGDEPDERILTEASLSDREELAIEVRELLEQDGTK